MQRWVNNLKIYQVIIIYKMMTVYINTGLNFDSAYLFIYDEFVKQLTLETLYMIHDFTHLKIYDVSLLPLLRPGIPDTSA